MVKKKKKQPGSLIPVVLATIAFFSAFCLAIIMPDVEEKQRQKKAALAKGIAEEIMQTAEKTKQDIETMIAKGTPWHEITFAKPMNVPCDTGKTCLFSEEGGGASVPKRPENARGKSARLFHWRFKRPMGEIGWWFDSGRLASKGVRDVGTEAPDLVATLEDIPQAVCRAINRSLGIPGIPVEDDREGRGELYILDRLKGHRQGCIQWVPWAKNLYVYFHVMVEN